MDGDRDQPMRRSSQEPAGAVCMLPLGQKGAHRQSGSRKDCTTNMHYQPIREKPLVGISLVGSNKRITRPNSSGTINAFPTDQDVMTLQEAAEFLKCNPATIKRRADALHIPYKRLGSLWRFSRKALEAWMADADNAMAA